MTEQEEWAAAASNEWVQVVELSTILKLAQRRFPSIYAALRDAFVAAFCRGARFQRIRQSTPYREEL